MAITSYSQEEAQLARTAKQNWYTRERFEAEILPKFRAWEIDAEGNIQEAPAKPKSMADVISGYAKKPLEFTQGAVTWAIRWAGNIAWFATRNVGRGLDVVLPWTPVQDIMRPAWEKVQAWAEKLASTIEGINRRDFNPESLTSKAGEFAWQVALTAPIGGIGTAGKLAWATKWALEAGTYAAASKWKVWLGDIALGGTLWATWAGISNLVKKAPEKLKAWATKSVMQALWPTKEKYKQMTEKLAPEFLKKWLVWGRESLQAKAVTSMDELGSQIDKMFSSGAVKWKIKTAPIIKSLDALKSKVWKVDIDPARSKVIDWVKDVIKQFWDDLSPEKARTLRQAMDKIVYSTKGVIADEALSVKNLARKSAADEIRKQFSAISPDLAKLNKEFNFWSSLDDILTETARRTWPQSWGLIDKIAGSGAFWGTLATWGGALPAIWAAVLTTKFVQAMKSPLWKTISAQSKNKLANAIANGSKTGIISAVNEIQKRIPKIPFALEIKNKLWLNE